MITAVCGGFALCAALMFLVASRLVGPGAATAEAPRHRRGQHGPWQWLSRWPMSPLARWLAPVIPARWRAVVGHLLERADLDDTLSAEQWLLAPLLVASGMAAVCYALADATGIAMLLRTALAAASGAALPCMALRDRIRTRQRQVLRELPGYLDLLTLALEAGCALNSALQMAVQRSPASPLRMALERSLQEMRAGSQRAEALRRLERRVGVAALGAAVAAIVQAEATGVSLAPVIRAQALRGTRERFARAEKLAMEAPVKMLAPLVLCIFPCTFIVIGFPIAVRLFWGM